MIGSTYINISKNLGLSSFKIFYKIIIPLSTPAIFSGLFLVIMEVLNEYGAVKYFGVNTYTTGIFRSWFSMGDIEDSTKIEMLTKYTVNQDLMSKVNSDCMFMHCLPANRSQEVSSEVIDGSQSYVWQEAQNRLHVQKELLLNFL
jgi:hypothetical protein